jgi:hypothetical protein
VKKGLNKKSVLCLQTARKEITGTFFRRVEMKKTMLFCLAVAVLLTFDLSAQAEEVSYPVTGSWQECFLGGGPGQDGNALFASGPGWEFSGAVLTGDPVMDVDGCYTTVYTGGQLVLTDDNGDPSGSHIATDITAVNYSCSAATLQCEAAHCFTITFSGFFDGEPCVWFKVEASYQGDLSGAFDCPDGGMGDELTEATITVIAPGLDVDEIFCKCAEGARNHGAFVKCVSHETNKLKKDKDLSGREKGVVQRCAAQQAYFPECPE